MASSLRLISPNDMRSAENLIKRLPILRAAVIRTPMTNSLKKFSNEIARGHQAMRSRSAAVKSLLLLGLTRGCWVL